MNQTLSIDVAATRLGISRFTLRSWLRQRRLPHYRLGRRIVLAEADVDSFMRANRVEAIEHTGKARR